MQKQQKTKKQYLNIQCSLDYTNVRPGNFGKLLDKCNVLQNVCNTLLGNSGSFQDMEDSVDKATAKL